jgi:hypothetical protein
MPPIRTLTEQFCLTGLLTAYPPATPTSGGISTSPVDHLYQHIAFLLKEKECVL